MSKVKKYHEKSINEVNLNKVELFNFNEVLFRHVDRILATLPHLHQFRCNVMGFEDIIIPLITRHSNQMEKFIVWSEEEMEWLDKNFPDESNHNTPKYIRLFYSAKFRVLMRIVNDKGWVELDKIIEWIGFKDKKSVYLLKHIARLYKKKQNCNIWFGGPPGSGKSESALSFCLALSEFRDKPFFIARNKDELIHMAHNEWKEDVPKGSIIFWDEMSTQANRRTWWKNIDLQDEFQTFRFRRLVLVMTAPDFDDVDSRINKFFHYLVEFNKNSVRVSEGYAVCKLKELSFGNNKCYKKYIRTQTGKNKELKKIFRMVIRKPPKNKVKKYRKIKEEYYKKLGEAKLKKEGEEVSDKKEFDTQKYVDMIKENPEEYKNKHGNITTAGIKFKFKLTEGKARLVRTAWSMSEG